MAATSDAATLAEMILLRRQLADRWRKVACTDNRSDDAWRHLFSVFVPEIKAEVHVKKEKVEPCEPPASAAADAKAPTPCMALIPWTQANLRRTVRPVFTRLAGQAAALQT